MLEREIMNTLEWEKKSVSKEIEDVKKTQTELKKTITDFKNILQKKSIVEE